MPPVNEPISAKPKPSKLRSTTKIPLSISQIDLTEEEPAVVAENKKDENSYGTKPFTIEELSKYWEAFKEKKKKEGKDSELAVLNQTYSLAENTITLKLTNTVKLNILDKFRSDLVMYLKQKLDNRYIELVTELVEEEQTRTPYTNKEKFEYLAEKKPILKELKNRLGLDPDF